MSNMKIVSLIHARAESEREADLRRLAARDRRVQGKNRAVTRTYAASRGWSPPQNKCLTRKRKRQILWLKCDRWRGPTPRPVSRRSGAYANGPKVEPDIKLRAIGMLLDRGWGKPNQPHTDAEGGELKIVLRTIVDHNRKRDR